MSFPNQSIYWSWLELNCLKSMCLGWQAEYLYNFFISMNQVKVYVCMSVVLFGNLPWQVAYVRSSKGCRGLFFPWLHFAVSQSVASRNSKVETTFICLWQRMPNMLRYITALAKKGRTTYTFESQIELGRNGASYFLLDISCYVYSYFSRLIQVKCVQKYT